MESRRVFFIAHLRLFNWNRMQELKALHLGVTTFFAEQLMGVINISLWSTSMVRSVCIYEYIIYTMYIYIYIIHIHIRMYAQIYTDGLIWRRHTSQQYNGIVG